MNTSILSRSVEPVLVTLTTRVTVSPGAASIRVSVGEPRIQHRPGRRIRSSNLVPPDHRLLMARVGFGRFGDQGTTDIKRQAGPRLSPRSNRQAPVDVADDATPALTLTGSPLSAADEARLPDREHLSADHLQNVFKVDRHRGLVADALADELLNPLSSAGSENSVSRSDQGLT